VKVSDLAAPQQQSLAPASSGQGGSGHTGVVSNSGEVQQQQVEYLQAELAAVLEERYQLQV